MNIHNESFSVTNAVRSPYRSKRRAGYDNQELNRQIGGWVVALMDAGFTENQSRRISRAVVYGPIIAIAIVGLTVGLR